MLVFLGDRNKLNFQGEDLDLDIDDVLMINVVCWEYFFSLFIKTQQCVK